MRPDNGSLLQQWPSFNPRSHVPGQVTCLLRPLPRDMVELDLKMREETWRRFSFDESTLSLLVHSINLDDIIGRTFTATSIVQ